MEASVYAADAELEANHWWYVGRRKLFGNLINTLHLTDSSDVVDIGTSSGTNLRLLADLGFSRIRGVDASPIAVEFCAAKGFDRVLLGDVCALPFEDGELDLVLATDIVEHVDDDVGAMREITRVLKPGGCALITVPAFRMLWGHQDDLSHHKRRYLKNDMIALCRDAGLKPVRSFYFNYLLFFPIYVARRLLRLSGTKPIPETRLNAPVLNRMLSAVFTVDIKTAPVLRPPFGVSFLVLAQRPEPAPDAPV
ncbi:MAG: class I SAM-dependent methyltransferase [Pseudomonadota bacterium]